MAMLVYGGVQRELASECILGRQQDCGVPIRDGGASRKHARVFQAEGGWWVEDLGSANGTSHNGQRLAGKARLRNGDAIRIGEAEVMFHCGEREVGPGAAAGPAVRLDPASLGGRLISGYRIGDCLGRAGMGFVYRARQLSLDREVAFKVFLRKVVDENPDFATRFRELAARSGSMRHVNFVALHENGDEDGLVWYSMEFVQGDTLERLIAREGRFSPELGLLVCERIAGAMAAAHAAGLVHRDLSLRTVMLTGDGAVKILDLGIAAALGRGRDRLRPETAWYCSPEIGGRGEPKPGDDAYSLGCILHHLLTGRPPFTGATPDEVMRAHREHMIPSLRKAVPGLPAKVEPLYQSLLNKNPDWRLADMAEAATALRALREELGQAAATAQGEAVSMVRRARGVRSAHETRVLRLTALIGGAVALLLAGYMVLPGLLRDAGDAAPAPPAVPRPAPAAIPDNPPPAPVPIPAAPQADPFAAKVQAVRARLAAGGTAWAAIEAELDRLGEEARSAAGSPAAAELRLLRAQFDGDSAGWYRAEIARLPRGEAPAEVAARITALAALRDQVASAGRADAEARWQQELAGLMQRLNEAKRGARRALESGHPADLAAIATRIAPAFAGTTVEGLSRQFATMCQEAARLQIPVSGDRRGTLAALEQAHGEPALAAGAALLVLGEVERARRVLLGDPQLGQGALLVRRSALLGGQAAFLAFDDPADLQFLDVSAGEPTLVGGALTGRAGDAATLVCTVPIGGVGDWQGEVAITLAAETAEAVLSCAKDGGIPLLLRLAGGRLLIRAATAGTPLERSVPVQIRGPHRLRLSCRDGDLQVALDGRSLLSVAGATVPPGSQLRLEFAGSAWRLEELQVVGAR